MYKLSNISIYIVALVSIWIIFDLQNWEKERRVIEWDIHSYYAYLPAIFIYNDIKLKKSDYQFDENYYLFWPTELKDGNKVIKTNLGVAFFYTPFFLIAHGLAHLTDYPENGFSEPYKLMLLMSSVFFLFIGLELVRKILLKLQFSDFIVAITLILIGLGTNLLAYSSQSAPLSHVYSFSLFAAFIYQSMLWYQKPTPINSIIIGLLIGLITLVRPTNIVISIFFLLYGVSKWDYLNRRLLFLYKKRVMLFLLVIFSFLVWTPQFLYWKAITGNYFYYSYTDEGFFFNKPQIINGLFSFRKGWLIYTPIMVFALVGILLLKKELSKFKIPIIFFLIINIYIIFSWWCWWYGGSFGQRAMIESYAILAIPFATFINFIKRTKFYFQILFYLLAGFFIWLNIFQTYQFEEHSLHWDGMSRELYFKQFGKIEKIDDFDDYVHWIDYDEAKRGGKKKKIINKFLDKNENTRKLVRISTFNGKFIRINIDDNSLLAIEEVDNEFFTIVYFNENACSIIGNNNKFVSAELNSRGELTASRDEPNFWETFYLMHINNDTVAFKAVNNKYVSLSASNHLIASADSIGQNEKFIISEE